MLVTSEYKELIMFILGKHCPYIGRFFNCANFRSALDRVSISDEVMVVSLNLQWLPNHLKSKEINSTFEWTLSGSIKSEAAVITARYYYIYYTTLYVL
jgi:hypothetical protein